MRNIWFRADAQDRKAQLECYGIGLLFNYYYLIYLLFVIITHINVYPEKWFACR